MAVHVAPCWGARATRLGVAVSLLGIALLTASCSGGVTTAPTAAQSGNAALVSVHYGRLADVYGLREVRGRATIEQVQRDVLIGPDIEDERGPTSTRSDPEILYDFLSVDPDTLQPRLLITREIGSAEFDEAFAALDRNQREISAGLFGQDTSVRPFSVAPRNAAIRLTFSEDLGIDEDFFVSRDAQGNVNGVRNTEAIQLLEIVGDPNDPYPRGDFVAVTARILPRGHQVILDPVLLGSEGVRYKARNNASGLPEAPDQIGANLRIAVALEGPLRIPGVHEPASSPFIGFNNSEQDSVVRDFRSGNRADTSPFISRGFLRETEPPRLLGEIPMLLEQVDRDGPVRHVVTIYKDSRDHEVDRGDVLRIVDPATGQMFATTDILEKPLDDIGQPAVQHVRAIVRGVEGLEDLDPRRQPGYPTNLREREAWLRVNAPRVVLVAEYASERIHPVSGEIYGDEIENFLTFTPEPLPFASGAASPSNRNISPFAGAIVRFTKPIDMTTVQPLDTFFIATRNVVDDDVIRSEFLEPHNIDPSLFDKNKFATPHLVASRIIDENGSQTSLRLQPAMGLFLSDEMRPSSDSEVAPGVSRGREFPYFLHLLSGREGVRDLSGNPVDFQSIGLRESLIVPFTLDTRRYPDGTPYFADNLVVHIARRFASEDEDERPSLYLPDEAPTVGSRPNPVNFVLPDMFGDFRLEGGQLSGPPTSRSRKFVDRLNQTRPPTTGARRWCPPLFRGGLVIAGASATTAFNLPLQNPLNPFGCRLQTAWRELDCNLSRIDPADFNLDVEQMYWAPFTLGAITYDEFDRVSLYLGHGEFRPVNCMTSFGSAAFASSGLRQNFDDNYVHDLDLGARVKIRNPPPHVAYVDERLFIDPAQAFYEPQAKFRYLPLPTFQEPYFVWRDETLNLQGGNCGDGADLNNARRIFDTYLTSPFLGGQGQRYRPDLYPKVTYWDNSQHFRLGSPGLIEKATDGLLGAIALPLMADFWTYCDDPNLPIGYPFRATGFNGWQISFGARGSPQPNFRVYSAGFAGSGSQSPICLDPSARGWQNASGGYTPSGSRTNYGDNSVFWIAADFRKRQTVATAGFVDIYDPHRLPAYQPSESDPRLGPFAPGITMLPNFTWTVEPPLDQLPAGSDLIAQFSATGPVDPEAWRAASFAFDPPPDEVNFPLDPFKAGDAWLRKFDDRLVAGRPRTAWTHLYNRNVTDYTEQITDLMDPMFLSRFAGPNERFLPEDVRYFNWRFLMHNNVHTNPPVSPVIDSFAITYRLEKLPR